MTFNVKWIHMARYELILDLILDGALWLRILDAGLPFSAKHIIDKVESMIYDGGFGIR